MKKLLFFLCLLFTEAKSQQTLIQVNTWNAYIHLPWDYNLNPTKKYPTIIFFPGLGEIGTNASLVIANGPGAYISQGWNGNVKIGNDSIKFIVISLQPINMYPPESAMQTRIQTLKSLYRIDSTKLYLTGLSHGGWCSTTYVTGDPYGGPYNYAKQVAAVVNVEGVQPGDNSPYPDLWDNYANVGGRLACFEQAQDFRDMQTYVNRMNSVRPNSAIYTRTNFGNGGHCCWNQFYGGQGVQPQNFLLDGVNQNIYQWMAKQTLNFTILSLDTTTWTPPRTVYVNSIKTYFNNNILTLNIESKIQTQYTVQIFNTIGQIVNQRFINVKKGNNNFNFITDLPKGVYFLKLCANSEIHNLKLYKN